MKDSKKSKRKRSYSSSYSSENSRDRSYSSSSGWKNKRSHKSKKSKHHNKRRSKSIQRQRSRHHDKPKDKHEQRRKHVDQQKDWHIKKQQPLQKHQDIKHNPHPRQILQQQNPQVKPEKQLPCFEPSGILLQYYNSRQGVSLRFHEPPQSRQPDQQWRMYIFKGQQVLQPVMLSKSCYLIGKDERVADILAQNPSISRQHAVIQFRLVQKRQTEGQFVEEVKPYVMDLESTNGTLLNDEKVQPGRYYQLLHRDVLKFGFSDREYVIVKWEENQQNQAEDQDE